MKPKREIAYTNEVKRPPIDFGGGIAMNRISPLLLAAALAAGLLGYVIGSAAPARAELSPHYEYKALSIIEFEVQGEKIPGENWVNKSHLDQPHKKIGDALLTDRAVMTKMLNAFAAEGWEPYMIYQNAIVVRRPAPK